MKTNKDSSAEADRFNNNGRSSAPSDHEERHRLGHVNTEGVIMQVGEKKKAFEMSCRFFCYQVASSSIANIVGTVAGHPLDTIRVSPSTLAKRALLAAPTPTVNFRSKVAITLGLLCDIIRVFSSCDLFLIFNEAEQCKTRSFETIRFSSVANLSFFGVYRCACSSNEGIAAS